MTIEDVLVESRLTLHHVGVVPLTLRAIVAAGIAIAIVATTAASWNAPDGYVAAAIVTGAAWSVAPDSHAGSICTGAVAATWLVGAPGGLGPAVVVAALGLLVAHAAAALGAAMPATATAEARLLLRWARPTAAIAVAVLGGAALVAVFDAWAPAGSIVTNLAALTLLTVAAWWWSAPPRR